MSATLIIAVFGAVLATATLIWNIYRDGFRDRARLRVFPAINEVMDWEIEHDVLTIDVRNIGGKPLILTHICLEGQTAYIFNDHTLPKKLGPGEIHISFCRKYEPFAKGLSRIYVIDSLGKKFDAPRKETKKVEAHIQSLAAKGVTGSWLGQRNT